MIFSCDCMGQFTSGTASRKIIEFLQILNNIYQLMIKQPTCYRTQYSRNERIRISKTGLEGKGP